MHAPLYGLVARQTITLYEKAIGAARDAYLAARDKRDLVKGGEKVENPYLKNDKAKKALDKPFDNRTLLLEGKLLRVSERATSRERATKDFVKILEVRPERTRNAPIVVASAPQSTTCVCVLLF